MNNKIHDALTTKYTLQSQGNTLFFGKPHGIYTVITFIDQNKKFRILLGVNKDQTMANLQPILDQVRSISSVKEVIEAAHTLEISGKTSIKSGSTIETIEAVLDTLLPHLKSEAYSSGSFDSGVDDGSVKLTQIDDDFYYLNTTDYKARIRQLDEKKALIDQTSENIPLGILGALLGASLGGALWAVIGHLGYIVWYVGFLAIFLAFYGYRLLGRKVSALGATLIFIITILVIIASNVVVYAWDLYDYVKASYDITFFEALKETPGLIFSDKEVTMMFLKDLGLGVGVLIIGGLFFMKGLYQKSSGQYEARRLD